MKEQLITFETAKLAKEKGFKWYVEHMQTYFSHEMWDKYLYPNSDVGDFQYSETAKRTKDMGFALKDEYPVPFYEPYYLCPTQSLLQKWLRDVHSTQVYVYSNTKNGKGEYRDYVVHINETAINDARDEEFQSYEEALEVGLQVALERI